MAVSHISKPTLLFDFLIFNLLALNPIFSHSLETLTTNNFNFVPPITLIGSATFSGDGSSVQLTASNVSSSGLILHKDPFKFNNSSSSRTMSFSTDFEFSFTGNLSGLSLVMGPLDFVLDHLGEGHSGVSYKKGFLRVDFWHAMDGEGSYSVLVRVNNDEPLGFSLAKPGEKLKYFIDYDASSKRLEILPSELSDKRPYDPFIADGLDLSKLFGDNEVYVALTSTNVANPLETCDVYSWRFRLRKVPTWMHSLPVNPHGSTGNSNGNESVHRSKFCPLTILAGLIFATGCGALLAFVVLFMWSIFVNRRTVFPIERKVQPMDFKYEKIGVVVEKDEKVVNN